MYKEMSIEELSEKFVNNLVETNRGFNFYVDWNNVMDYKHFEIELNALHFLFCLLYLKLREKMFGKGKMN